MAKKKTSKSKKKSVITPEAPDAIMDKLLMQRLLASIQMWNNYDDFLRHMQDDFQDFDCLYYDEDEEDFCD